MTEQGPQEKPPSGSGLHLFELTGGIFETYTDAMNATASPETVTLMLGIRATQLTPAKASAIIRMSPQFAKRVIMVLTLLIDRIVTIEPVEAEGQEKQG
jgi:hypothetical protein